VHDPMSQAFVIPFPWRSRGSKYRPPFLTVWHVDPETDGSDDSCGYTRPRLSKDQKARIESIAGDEAREPWFMAYRGKQIDSPTEAETLLRQAFLLVGKIFTKEHRCKPAIRRVTFAEASEWASAMLANPVDNFRSSLAFLPGYHSNNEKDTEHDRQYCAAQFFYCVGAFILRERRPWYKHAKWHVWHWQLQIHPLEQFKRWAFSRCFDCGKRFKWGESPYTNSWNSEGPKWFRSERDVHHMGCPLRPKG
jgi:hypothetical protein